MNKKTRNAVIGIGVAVAVFLFYQENRRSQRDPIEFILESRPTPISHQIIGRVRVKLDGQDITEEQVVLRSQSEVKITGELEDLQPFGHYPMGWIHIAFRTAGTPDAKWEQVERRQEWVCHKQTQFEFTGNLDIPPGSYEIRVYVISYSTMTLMPTVEHVLDGTMKVEFQGDGV